MPISELRDEPLSQVSADVEAFRSSLPEPLQEEFKASVAKPLGDAVRAARETVDAIDGLEAPDAPALNNAREVRRDTVSEGSRRYSEAIRNADQAISKLGRDLEGYSIPPAPKDPAASARARDTVRTVIGDGGAQSVGRLERLVTDPEVAGELLSSAWGQAVLDEVGFDARERLTARAMDAAFKGSYGPTRKRYAKAASKWGTLTRARTNAGLGDVVLQDLGRKS